MRQPPGAEDKSRRPTRVLSVSPAEEDHFLLRQILAEPAPAEFANYRWVVHAVHSLPSAVWILRDRRIPIVVCERDLMPGTWKDMLEQVRLLPAPHLLIVTSRTADEHLWAEALNLGAYDVLAKPFNRTEVVRIVSLAWLHAKDHKQMSGGKPAPKLAAWQAG